MYTKNNKIIKNNKKNRSTIPPVMLQILFPLPPSNIAEWNVFLVDRTLSMNAQFRSMPVKILASIPMSINSD